MRRSLSRTTPFSSVLVATLAFATWSCSSSDTLSPAQCVGPACNPHTGSGGSEEPGSGGEPGTGAQPGSGSESGVGGETSSGGVSGNTGGSNSGVGGTSPSVGGTGSGVGGAGVGGTSPGVGGTSPGVGGSGVGGSGGSGANFCVSNQRSCDGDMVVTCDTTGSAYVNPTPCGVSRHCWGGQCLPWACDVEPGTFCRGNSAINCINNRTSQTETSCGAQQCYLSDEHVARCGTPLCTPNQRSCNGGTTWSVCDATGFRPRAVDCGAEGLACFDTGGCTSSVTDSNEFISNGAAIGAVFGNIYLATETVTVPSYATFVRRSSAAVNRITYNVYESDTLLGTYTRVRTGGVSPNDISDLAYWPLVFGTPLTLQEGKYYYFAARLADRLTYIGRTDDTPELQTGPLTFRGGAFRQSSLEGNTTIEIREQDTFGSGYHQRIVISY